LVIHPVLRGNDAAGSLRVWHLLFEVNSTSVFTNHTYGTKKNIQSYIPLYIPWCISSHMQSLNPIKHIPWHILWYPMIYPY
jgi:hypothetical protein